MICTPHIGAQSKEAQNRAGVSIAEEVVAALQGKELRWRVLANEYDLLSRLNLTNTRFRVRLILYTRLILHGGFIYAKPS